MYQLVVALLLLLLLAPVRHLLFQPVATQGAVLKQVRVGWRQRLHHQAVSLFTGALLLLAGSLAEGPRSLLFVIFVLGLLLRCALPLHYTITDQGLQIGRSRFHHWTEFAGLSASQGLIRLQRVSGGRPVTLRLCPAAAADLEPLLRRQIWLSYRGTQPVQPVQPAARPAPSPGPQGPPAAFRSAQG